MNLKEELESFDDIKTLAPTRLNSEIKLQSNLEFFEEQSREEVVETNSNDLQGIKILKTKNDQNFEFKSFEKKIPKTSMQKSPVTNSMKYLSKGCNCKKSNCVRLHC